MAREERKEFAKLRVRLLNLTESRQFICARCGLSNKSIHIHHRKHGKQLHISGCLDIMGKLGIY